MSRQFLKISEDLTTLNPLDMHKEIKSRNFEQTKDGIVVAHSLNEEVSQGQMLDITQWLAQAAPHYHISPDISDYVMVPVATVPAEFPNRNGVGFPLSTLMEFIPEAGMLSYQTFKGKPTFYEHENKDITKAKGIIADSFLRRLPGYNGNKAFKLVKLLCFDRTKDEVLAKRILKNDINTYSMGAYLKEQVCSYCMSPVGRCVHIDPRRPVTFYEKDGHVVHKIMRGVTGFETSAVESPAWSIAISDDLVAAPSGWQR
jgi:hypothetical protein